MDRQPPLQFPVGDAVDVELLFDEPKTGEGANGPWTMYKCLADGQERVFFATRNLHERLQRGGAHKGSQVRIVKTGEKSPFLLYVDGQEVSTDAQADTYAPATTSAPDKAAIIAGRMAMARALAGDDGHETQNSIFIQLNRDQVTPPARVLREAAELCDELFA